MMYIKLWILIQTKNLFKKARRERKKYTFFILAAILFVGLFLIHNNRLCDFYIFCAYIFFFFIPVYVIVIFESKKIFEIGSFLIGAYTLIFTVCMARYELYIDRENQRLNTLISLVTADKRKNFSQLLATTTRMSSIKKPNILNFEENILMAIDGVEENNREYSKNAILVISGILNGYRDWSNANFLKLNMKNSELININFSKCILQESNFSNSIVRNIDFSDTELTKSSFRNAIIINCTFDNANLQNVDFQNSTILKSSFKNANLQYAYFFKARFYATDFCKADFSYSSFVHDRVTPKEYVSGYIIYKDKPDIKKMFTDITCEQIQHVLYSVKTLYGAQLPDKVRDKLKKERPNIFEKIGKQY